MFLKKIKLISKALEGLESFLEENQTDASDSVSSRRTASWLDGFSQNLNLPLFTKVIF